jgi:hypothetical protein
VIRYGLFLENIKAENIDPFFLVDFMSLPLDYFEFNAGEKYEKFIFRYGTHYIHSAEFGGQILFENSRTAEKESNINDMSEKAWNEIQTAFGSSSSVNGDINIPLQYLTADVGGGIKHIQTSIMAQKNRNENQMKNQQE